MKIIKLGGSVITDKLADGVIRNREIAELAGQIAGCNEPLIVVHGAGSLGHPQAKAFGISAGVTPANARGVYETHTAVARLNTAVVSALRDAGVEAVSFPPLSCALSENRRLVFCGEDQIRCLLAAGITPVLHGDVVTDTRLGGCIVSGDQIVPYLARALAADAVGIVTATGGVLDGGRVVPEITRERASALDLGGSAAPDVTGGMRGKINELLMLADAGVPSYIFAPEYLGDFLNGRPYPQTMVRKA